MGGHGRSEFAPAALATVNSPETEGLKMQVGN